MGRKERGGERTQDKKTEGGKRECRKEGRQVERKTKDVFRHGSRFEPKMSTDVNVLKTIKQMMTKKEMKEREKERNSCM